MKDLVQTHAEPATELSGHPGCNICGERLHMGCCNPSRPAGVPPGSPSDAIRAGAAQVTEPLVAPWYPHYADPLDVLTWKLSEAFGATVTERQWLAARELLVPFEPRDLGEEPSPLAGEGDTAPPLAQQQPDT